jgi:thymidylate synthase
MLEYDMEYGFPLLTTKKMAWKAIRVELEGFIKGITDKRWFQSRGCKIWNEWCTPSKIQYKQDKETLENMANEPDLGPIYGYQWRNFNGNYSGPVNNPLCVDDKDGIDQLAWAVSQIKHNPQSRRIIVNAWNPAQLQLMALVPCHYSFQLLCNDGVLDLLWNQRSCDLFLGIPFNIASYGLLLELIAKECNLKPGKLIGFLGDVHIYSNHLDQVNEQLNRTPYTPPTLELSGYDSIFDWDWNKANIKGYNSHAPIKAQVAV